MAQTPASTPGTVTKAPRVSPSLGVGLGVVVVYATIFTATAASSGIPYTEWFSSAPNVWRTAVLPLALGAVFLIGFLAWARWDGVFRDHNRLAGPRILRIAAAVFIVGIVVHLVFVDWAGLDPAIVAPILITGVLVGFCEETLFRGILLRGTRTKGRSEATAAICHLGSVWAVPPNEHCYWFTRIGSVEPGPRGRPFRHHLVLVPQDQWPACRLYDRPRTMGHFLVPPNRGSHDRLRDRRPRTARDRPRRRPDHLNHRRPT